MAAAAAVPSWSDECPICHDEMSDRVFIHPCNHDFDRGCIDEWRSQSNSCPVCRGRISSLKEPSAMPRPPKPPAPVAPSPRPSSQDTDALQELLAQMAISAQKQEDEELENAMLTIAQMESAASAAEAAANEAFLAGVLYASHQTAPSETCTICSQAITNRAVVLPCFHEFDLHCINSITDSDEIPVKKCPTCDQKMQEIQFEINGPDSYSVKKVTSFGNTPDNRCIQ